MSINLPACHVPENTNIYMCMCWPAFHSIRQSLTSNGPNSFQSFRPDLLLWSHSDRVDRTIKVYRQYKVWPHSGRKHCCPIIESNRFARRTVANACTLGLISLMRKEPGNGTGDLHNVCPRSTCSIRQAIVWSLFWLLMCWKMLGLSGLKLLNMIVTDVCDYRQKQSASVWNIWILLLSVSQ